MRISTVLLLLALVLSISLFPVTHSQAQPAFRASGPAPLDVLGFIPGDDRKLASWNQVLTYFDKLDRGSNRVKFESLGKTTMDVPFVMVTISSPENLARLDEYKRIQDLLADPRRLGPPAVRDRKARELIRRGKTVVLITCGIHSTEVGSYLSSMLIAHRLASSNEPEIEEILRNTIILLVPSLNPDGVDIVKNWYDKTLGTPYEGTEPPELYHKYVGHDNNRDWYAFTQAETKITVDKIHNVWHPQIVHDIHQQGAFGSRLFLPPYMPPVEPNVPKQIVDGYTELGNWIASEMRKAGFEGITTGSTYDAWTPARAYSHYHGGVRILSETASARIASPITIKVDQLRPREGYDPQKESPKFGPVWKGGEWRLRNITNYMTTAAFTLLKHASQNREQWLTNFYSVGKEAVRPRRPGELFGFIVPFQFGNYPVLLDTLRRAGVDFDVAEQFTFGRKIYQNGAAIVPMAQPYGSFAAALLREQAYPNLRDASGHPIPPYDVTAHTLPLLYGVPVVPVYQAPRYRKLSPSPGMLTPYVGSSTSVTRVGLYKSHVPSMDEGWTRWILEQSIRRNSSRQRREHSKLSSLSLSDSRIREGKLSGSYDAILFPDQSARTILNGYAQGTMPPEYTGGVGQEGVKALREFVQEGGTLVFINRASEFAIEQFKLPVRNAVAHVLEKDFFVPGSILRIELDTSHPVAHNMPPQSVAWVEDSPVFEIKGGEEGKRAHVIARYPSAGNPLLSGWLLGADRLKGQAALVEISVGKGRLILFGFRPQYRAQSLATYPLLFNSLRRR
ncbi:MAG TPA: M14 metallopeptidase family protein [Pyrinomonadaceae bacterium]|nr:M14 metallopeptidase family protein [Pyrinomonadaceae bacterium]